MSQQHDLTPPEIPFFVEISETASHGQRSNRTSAFRTLFAVVWCRLCVQIKQMSRKELRPHFIEFECPHCCRRLRAETRKAGQRLRCPHQACLKILAVPAVPPPSGKFLARFLSLQLSTVATIMVLLAIGIGGAILRAPNQRPIPVVAPLSDASDAEPSSPQPEVAQADNEASTHEQQSPPEMASSDEPTVPNETSNATPPTKAISEPSAPTVSPPKKAEEINVKDDSERVAPKPRGLSDTDIALLRTGGCKYYLNEEMIIPERPGKYPNVFDRNAAELTSDQSRIAALILFFDRLALALGELVDAQNRELTQVRQVIFDAAFKDSVKAAFDGDVPSFFEYARKYREQPGLNGVVEWVDDNRMRQFLIALSKIAINQTEADITDGVTRLVSSHHGDADLSQNGTLKLAAIDHDEVCDAKEKRFNKHPREGRLFPTLAFQFIKLTYNGADSLTNVVAVAHLETTGMSDDFSPEESVTLPLHLASNALVGMGDRNEEIVAWQKSEKRLTSMPMTSYAYIPEIRPGDVVYVALGRADPKLVKFGSIAAYCDQGYIPQKKFTFPKPKQRRYKSKLWTD